MKYFLVFLIACFLAGYSIDKFPKRLRPFIVPALCLFIIAAFFVFNKI